MNNPQIQAQYVTSFEELLLQKVSQHSKNTGTGPNKTVKLTRAAKGSEVITRTYLEKIKEKEQNTHNTNLDSIETTTSQPSTNHNEKLGKEKLFPLEK